VSDRTKIMLEVSTWIRDHGRNVRGPYLLMSKRDLDIWLDGYGYAVNDMVQHFNSEYLESRQKDLRKGDYS
jgi:hypothetical protein